MCLTPATSESKIKLAISFISSSDKVNEDSPKSMVSFSWIAATIVSSNSWAAFSAANLCSSSSCWASNSSFFLYSLRIPWTFFWYSASFCLANSNSVEASSSVSSGTLAFKSIRYSSSSGIESISYTGVSSWLESKYSWIACWAIYFLYSSALRLLALSSLIRLTSSSAKPKLSSDSS